jgi:hypothetical protein
LPVGHPRGDRLSSRSAEGDNVWGGSRPRIFQAFVWSSRWVCPAMNKEPERVISVSDDRKGLAIMEQGNIRIGNVAFDHADYDAENDVLYLSLQSDGLAGLSREDSVSNTGRRDSSSSRSSYVPRSPSDCHSSCRYVYGKDWPAVCATATGSFPGNSSAGTRQLASPIARRKF